MQWFSARQRGLALGVRQTAIPLGGAVAALTLPAMNGAGGLEASFAFLGGLCLASAAVAAVVVREPPRPVQSLEAEDVEWTLRDRRLWILSTGSGLYLFAQIALTSFLVLFLHDEHGLSAGAAAGVLAVSQVGADRDEDLVGPDLGRDARSDPPAALDRACELRRGARDCSARRCAGRRHRSRDGRRRCDLDGLERPVGDRSRGARRTVAERRRYRFSADDALVIGANRPRRASRMSSTSLPGRPASPSRRSARLPAGLLDAPEPPTRARGAGLTRRRSARDESRRASAHGS